jgi:hypothetical protein
LFILGLVGLFFLQLFGPQPAIVVSKRTTFITKPLAEDGLPDFGRAVDSLRRQCVTAENNGARLFWMAVGPPQDVSPHMPPADEYWKQLCRDLEIPLPIKRPLRPLFSKERHQQVMSRLAAERGVSIDPNDADYDPESAKELSQRANELIWSASDRPWTAEEIPEAGQWLAEHAAALDLIVEAVSKPYFYNPSAKSLAELSLPSSVTPIWVFLSAREAARCLLIRANNCVARKDFEGAWRDVLACWRLGGRVADSSLTLNGLTFGTATRGMAIDSTLGLIGNEGVSDVLLDQIGSDLAAEATTFDVAELLDQSERLFVIDYAINALTERKEVEKFEELESSWTVKCSADPNEVLKVCNKLIDEIVAAAELPSGPLRREAYSAFMTNLIRLSDDKKTKSPWLLFSRRNRSEAVGARFAREFLPTFEIGLRCADRDVTDMQLTRLAIALERHRRRTGAFPETLAALVPTEIAAVPKDLYTGKSLIYKLRGEGYLLYSVGENGADDGGTDAGGPIVNGEWLPEESAAEQEIEGDDQVIRMPRPKVQSGR